jgi:predicted transcriptional regulator
VVYGSGATIRKEYLAGETITAGMAVYLKSSDSRLWKAQADGTAAEAAFVGVALNGASAGQPVQVQSGGEITIGATVAIGTVYVVATTAGGIAPVADLISTNYVTVVGVGTTAAILTILPIVSGIQKA